MTVDRSVLDVFTVGGMFVGAAAVVGVFWDILFAHDAIGLDDIGRACRIEDDPLAAILPKQPHVRNARTDFRLPHDIAHVALIHLAQEPERLCLTVAFWRDSVTSGVCGV